jgi:hypothetical protein
VSLQKTSGDDVLEEYVLAGNGWANLKVDTIKH